MGYGGKAAIMSSTALSFTGIHAQSGFDAIYQGDETGFVQQIAGFVTQRANALLKLAPEIPKFKKDSF